MGTLPVSFEGKVGGSGVERAEVPGVTLTGRARRARRCFPRNFVEGLTNGAAGLIKYAGAACLADRQEGEESLVSEEAELSHRTEEAPGALILCLKGEIDCTHSNELSELLGNIRESDPKNLIVDLDEVDYIDSSGLGVLVSERMRWLKEGHHFRLCCPTAAVRTVLQTSHLDHFFEIYPTREAALEEEPAE